MGMFFYKYQDTGIRMWLINITILAILVQCIHKYHRSHGQIDTILWFDPGQDPGQFDHIFGILTLDIITYKKDNVYNDNPD